MRGYWGVFIGWLMVWGWVGLPAEAGVSNLLENPSFELHNRGELMFWVHRVERAEDVQWFPLSPARQDTIRYVLDTPSAHTGRAAVLFQTPDLAHSLQYWRWIGERTLEIAQWRRSPIHVSAWFRAERPGATLRFQIRLSGATSLMGVHTERVVLDAPGWQQVTFTLPVDAFGGKPVQSLDLRVSYESGEGAVWCDDVRVFDELTPSAFPAPGEPLSMDAEGALRTSSGERWIPQILWDAGVYAPPISLKPLYALIAQQGFNAISLKPSYDFNYATKRHLQIMLDAAYEAGLKAIVQVPTYPLGAGGCRFHREYIQDWVATFRDHPALLGWFLGETSNRACLDHLILTVEEGQRLRDWIHEAESPWFHPVLLATSERVYLDPEAYGGLPGSRALDHLIEMAWIADVLVPNVFPLKTPGDVPGRLLSRVTDQAWDAIRLVQSQAPSQRRSVWPMIQVAALTEGGVIPSPDSVRLMATQALLHRAGGLAYYAAGFCYDPYCVDTWSLPNHAPELWEAFPTLIANLNDLVPRASSGPGEQRVLPSSAHPVPPWLDGVLSSDPGAGADFEGDLLTLRRSPEGETLLLLRPQMEAIRKAVGDTPVQRAELRLWIAQREGEGFGTIYAHEVLAPWNPASVSWQRRPDFAPQPLAVAEVPSDGPATRLISLSWDVTSLVRAWLAATKPAYGLALRVGFAEDAAFTLRFPSSRYQEFHPLAESGFLPQLSLLLGDAGEPFVMVDDAQEAIETHLLGRDAWGQIRLIVMNTDAVEARPVRFYAPALAGSVFESYPQGTVIQGDPFGYFEDVLGPLEVRLYLGGWSPEELDRRRADVNRDGTVDILDLVAVGAHFGERIPEDWQGASQPDVNRDGVVDILDLTRVAREFGTQFVPAAPVQGSSSLLSWRVEAQEMTLVAKAPVLAFTLAWEHPGTTDNRQTALLNLPSTIDNPQSLWSFSWHPAPGKTQWVGVRLGSREIPPRTSLIRMRRDVLPHLVGGQAVLTTGQVVPIPLPSHRVVASPAWLGPNYPNPSNPETWIPYVLAVDAPVEITLFAADGRVVRRYSLGWQQAGAYVTPGKALHWDGRNALGERVASGVYFYRLRAGAFTTLRKLSVIR